MKVNGLFDQFARDLLECLASRFPLGYQPELEWRNFRTSAGMAAEFEGRILLSANLLDSFEKVEDTVKHEYAHLLAVARHGWRGRGHGAAWRKAMRELGLSPDVHHNYECRRNQTHQVVKYRCVKCGAIIERKRKFPRGKRYEHLNCGGAIHFHSIEPVIQVEPAA